MFFGNLLAVNMDEEEVIVKGYEHPGMNHSPGFKNIRSRVTFPNKL